MVLFVYGEDGYRIDQKLKQLSEHFRGKFDGQGMNVDVFDARDVALGAARDVIVAPPFLASKRFVIVRHFSAWSGEGVTPKKRRSAKAKKDTALRTTTAFGAEGAVGEGEVVSPLAQLLKRIPETSIVVFVDVMSVSDFSALGLSDRASWFYYPYPALDARALESFACEEARRLGVTLSPAVAHELIGKLPLDSWYVATEVAKLAAAVGLGGVVGRNHIAEHLDERASDRIFDFVDAIAEQDMAQTLALLENQLAFGSHPFQLLTMIERQVRMLLAARSLYEEGCTTPDRLASSLGAHPFVARKLLATVSGARGERVRARLTSLLCRIAEVDGMMKTGQIEPTAALTLLVT